MLHVKPQLLRTAAKKLPNYKLRPLSKTLKIFFILIQIIFAIDNGFTKFIPIRRVVVKFWSVFNAFSVDIICFILLESGKKIEYRMWFTKYLFEHLTYILIFLFIPQNKSFCDFLQNLQTIDCQVGTKSKYFNIKIILCCITCFSVKIVLSGIYCYRNEDCIVTVLAQMIYFLPFLALDLPFIMMVFTFYAAQLRLMAIGQCLLDKKMAKQMHQAYKALIDLTESAKKSFDPVIIMTLFFNVPSVMLIMYQIIIEIKLSMKTPVGYVSECCSVTSLLIVIFAPCMFASSLLTEAQNIKIILHDMKFETTDQNQVKDIDRFIQYVDARPFKFSILKIFPFDATLPIMIINLCVTYLIVILQLTHTY